MSYIGAQPCPLTWACCCCYKRLPSLQEQPKLICYSASRDHVRNTAAERQCSAEVSQIRSHVERQEEQFIATITGLFNQSRHTNTADFQTYLQHQFVLGPDSMPVLFQAFVDQLLYVNKSITPLHISALYLRRQQQFSSLSQLFDAFPIAGPDTAVRVNT